jgi:polysaccharide biosynthesis/export protein
LSPDDQRQCELRPIPRNQINSLMIPQQHRDQIMAPDAILSIQAKVETTMKLLLAHKILLSATFIMLMQNTALASDTNATYVLAPGDVLSVKDDDGVVTQAPVLPDGISVINYAGSIEAAGKTIADIERLVNEAAKKWFASPHIQISLSRQRPNQVYILGQVQHSGLYSPKREATELADLNAKPKEAFTISNLLEMAGGLKEGADIKHIHVTRLHPKTIIDVDLWKLLLDGVDTDDLVLQPGDVIYVPKAGTESGTTNDLGKITNNTRMIRVMGAIKKPGLVLAANNSKELSSVISAAGGFLAENTKYTISVVRTKYNGEMSTEHIAVDSNQHYSDQPVKAGDIVIVKANTTDGDSKSHPINNIPGLPQHAPIGDFGPRLMLRTINP